MTLARCLRFRYPPDTGLSAAFGLTFSVVMGGVLGGESPIYWPGFGLSLAIVAFFLWLGVSQFRKMEKTFADVI